MMSRFLFALCCLPSASFAQWYVLDPGTNQDIRSVHYKPDGQVLLGAFDTTYWSFDHGSNFFERATLQGAVPVFGLYLAAHALDANTALITGTMNAGAAESIYRTTDAGSQWTLQHYQDVDLIDILWDIEMAEAPIGLAVGSNGRILRTTNNGLDWTAVPSPTTWTLQHVVHAGSNIYLACGPNAFVRSTDGGSTWTTVVGPAGAEGLTAIGAICYAAAGGQIWKSVDSGASWSVNGVSMGPVIEMLDQNTLIAANDTGLFRSTTGGAYWEIFDLPGYRKVRQIDFHDATAGIAVGDEGYVIRTGNGGGPAVPIARIEASVAVACTGASVSFSHNGDPANAYSWIINGMPVSDQVSLTTSFTSAGTYTIELFADNGTAVGSDEMILTVLEAPVVPDFVAYAAQDTVCVGSSTNIMVPITETGCTYILRRNGVQVGGSLAGGSSLTIPTGSVNAPTLFTVVGRRWSACGVDSFVVDIPITVPQIPAGTTWAWLAPYGCAPVVPTVRIINSHPAFVYRVNAQQWAQGNGGDLLIPMPEVTGNSTVTATVRTRLITPVCSEIVMPSPGPFLVYATGASFSINSGPSFDNLYALVGQLLTVSVTTTASLQYDYEIGPNANPASYTGATPPVFSFADPGLGTVTLTVTGPNGECPQSASTSIMVVDSMPTTVLSKCHDGAAGFSGYITDMCLDGQNNRYITGFHHAGATAQYAFFAMKLDSAGNEIWRYQGPPNPNAGSFGYGIAADRAGNAYVTGRFDHDVGQMDGIAIPRSSFLVKLDRLGHLAWQMSSPGYKLRGVACTPDNLVHVAGYNAWTPSRLLLPSGIDTSFVPVPGDPGHGNAFIMTVDPDGGLVSFDALGRKYNVNNPAVSSAINMNSDALDANDRFRCDPLLKALPSGELLMAGVMEAMKGPNQFMFDDIPVVNNAAQDTIANTKQVYALRYQPGTGVVTAFSIAGGRIHSIQGIDQASNGDLVVCGRYQKPFLYNGVVEAPVDVFYPPTGGYYYSYFMRTDPQGQALWHVASPNRTSVIHDAAFAPDGSIYALAGFGPTGIFPDADGTLRGIGSGAQSLGAAVLHYGPGGSLLGSEFVQGPWSGTAFNLRPDACGNLHVAVLRGSAAASVEHTHIACTGCPDNLLTFALDVGGCGLECHADHDPASRDVAMSAIGLDDLLSVTPTVRVSLRSMGQVQAETIEIRYQVNEGPIQSVAWSGQLAYAQVAVDLPLTQLDFASAHTRRVVAWIHSVNGSPDDLLTNDTLRLSHAYCFAPLAGTYSCGGDGAYFRTFREATEVLAQCGVSAPTVIAINDGIYDEQLHVLPVTGSSVVNTVTFTSASQDSASVRIRYRPGTSHYYQAAALSAQGTDHVIFKDLTFEHRVSVNQNHVLVLGQLSQRVRVEGCHILAGPLATGQIGLLGDTPLKHVSILGNTIDHGSRGIVFSAANNNAPAVHYDSLHIIAGNLLRNQYHQGAYLLNVRGLRFERNTILSEDAYNADSYRAVWAFDENGTIPMRFERNFIRVSTLAQVGGQTGELAKIGVVNNGSARSTIANNMIFNPMQGDQQVLPSVTCFCRNTDFVFNTVGGRSQFSHTAGMVLHGNLFYSADDAAPLVIAGDTLTMNSDWNVLSAGADGMHPGVIRYQGMEHTLSAWQAGSSFETNSVQLLPEFVSVEDPHLIMGANAFTCPRLSTVDVDIDGDARGPMITRQGADVEDVALPLQEALHAAGFSVVPNPSNGQTAIRLSEPALLASELRCLDSTGRLLFSSPIAVGTTSLQLGLPFAPGVYSVQLVVGGVPGPAERLVIAPTLR
jgi:photosystem II stability/assembly factor-like uncharacterized protein